MKNYYTLANLKKIKWGVLEENNPISLYPIMLPGWSQIIKKTGHILGRPQKSAICLQMGRRGIIFIDHQEWTGLGEFALKRITAKPQFADVINQRVLKLSDELTSFTTKLFKTNLKPIKTEQLLKWYGEFEERHGDLYSYAIIPVYLELYKPHLTKYLVDYLFNQVSKIGYHLTAKECFAHLTVPDKFSQVQLEEQSFLRLAGVAKNKSKLAVKLQKHFKNFCYQGYNFEGPAFTREYFITRLKEFTKSGADCQAALRQIFINKRRALQLRIKIARELKIDPHTAMLFKTARDIIYGKDYRKMAMVRSYYQIEPLLKEIGKRLGLSLGEVRNCRRDELAAMAAGKIKRPPELSARMKGCLFAVADKKLPGIIDTKVVYHQMKKYLLRAEDLSEVNYFHGQTATTGKARGIVKVINFKKDLPKMNAGDILVSQMTNPDLVSAMKKAAAIITDMGGITCHAAIISRELKIPCIIGTKVATKVLKDGDEVLVDADQGEVKKM